MLLYTKPTFPNSYNSSEISDVSTFMGDRINEHNAKQAHEAKVARSYLLIVLRPWMMFIKLSMIILVEWLLS